MHNFPSCYITWKYCLLPFLASWSLVDDIFGSPFSPSLGKTIFKRFGCAPLRFDDISCRKVKLKNYSQQCTRVFVAIFKVIRGYVLAHLFSMSRLLEWQKKVRIWKSKIETQHNKAEPLYFIIHIASSWPLTSGQDTIRHVGPLFVLRWSPSMINYSGTPT